MKKPFLLMVDSANEAEPEPRRFASLDAAKAALDKYEEEWQRYAWIIERRGHDHVIHVRDGVRTDAKAGPAARAIWALDR